MKEGIGDSFQQETKYERGKLPGGYLDWEKRPDTHKNYPSAVRFKLKPPHIKDGASLWEVILNRRSTRSFREQPLPEEKLSLLLWATQGITREEQGFAFRAAPSAGALYPIETYLVVHNVEGFEPGIYHYAVSSHELELLKAGDFRLETAQAALDQDMAYAASVVFIWTAMFARSKWKYKQRAYRYVFLDAGHIAENLALAAVALDLGSCQMAALYDDEANALLAVDGKQESVIYMSVVGNPY